MTSLLELNQETYFWFQHFVPLWLNEEPNTVYGSRKCTTSNQETNKQDVWERGGEEDHFSCSFDWFPDAKVDNDPSQNKESEKFPTDTSKVFNV